MPSLNLALPDGTQHTVQVDDTFNTLPPAQQETTVNEIAASLGQRSPTAVNGQPAAATPSPTATVEFQMPDGTSRKAEVDGAFRNMPLPDQTALVSRMRQTALDQDAAKSKGSFDVAGARAAGHSDSDIANEMSRGAGYDVAAARAAGHSDADIIGEIASRVGGAPRDTSYTGALKQGIESVGQGLGATAQVVGDATGSPTLSGLGRSLNSLSASDPTYQPAGPEVAAALRAGRYRDALFNAPRAITEAVPGLVGGLAASAVPGGLPAYLAATNYGQHVQARQAANGDKVPTTNDLTIGGLSTIPDVGLGMIGLGKLPGVASAVARVPTMVGRTAAGAALDAGAAGAQSLVDQAGNTIGTKQGLMVDPADAATAAIQAAGARAGTLGAHEVGAKTGEVARDAATAMTYAQPSTDEAHSISRVNSAADAYRATAQNTTGRAPTDAATLDALHSKLSGNLKEIAKQLVDAGAITPEEHRAILAPAIRDAATFRPSDASDAGARPSAGAIDDLDIPDAIRGPLQDAVSDLSTIQAARRNDNAGPFATLGQGAATYGTAGAALAMGHPTEAIMTLLGHRQVGAIGGAAGGLVDRLVGTNSPSVFQRSGQADGVLTKAGETPRPDSITATNDALTTLRDPQARLNLSLGLPLDTPAAPAAAAAPASTPTDAGNAQAARDQAALVAKLGPDHPVGAAALDALGTNPLAEQALSRWNALAPVRSAQARTAQAAQDSQVQTAQAAKDTADQLRRDKQQKQTDLEAALGTRAKVTAVLDNAASRNEVALQAAGEQPRVDDASLTAITAAMNQAQRRANAVKAQGGDNRLGVPSDTAEPTVDPVAQARLRASAASPGGVQEPQAAIPAATPPVASASPAAASTGDSGTLPSGWMAYTLSGLLRNGIVAKPADVHGAVDDLVSAGELSPTHGDALKKHSGPVMVPELLQRIASVTASRTGQSDRLTAGLTAPAPAVGPGDAPGQDTSGKPPVRDQFRWASARDAYQKAADGLALQAERQGDTALSTAIRHIAAEPTEDGKAQIAKDYLVSLKGKTSGAVLKKALAAQMLSGPLMRGTR
jgi:hypothetical protein